MIRNLLFSTSRCHLVTLSLCQRRGTHISQFIISRLSPIATVQIASSFTGIGQELFATSPGAAIAMTPQVDFQLETERAKVRRCCVLVMCQRSSRVSFVSRVPNICVLSRCSGAAECVGSPSHTASNRCSGAHIQHSHV